MKLKISESIEMDTNTMTISEFWELYDKCHNQDDTDMEIFSWLFEHDDLYKDLCNHFNIEIEDEEPLAGLDFVFENMEKVIDWLSIHKIAWEDFTRYMKDYIGDRCNINESNENKDIFKLNETIVDALEDAEFSLNQEDVYGGERLFEFSKYSSAGQDFNFSVYAKDMADLQHNLYEYYQGFDVSYETSLWLDDEGHGKNGAPYDMKDVYEDMEECRELILEALNIIEDNFVEDTEEDSNDEE